MRLVLGVLLLSAACGDSSSGSVATSSGGTGGTGGTGGSGGEAGAGGVGGGGAGGTAGTGGSTPADPKGDLAGCTFATALESLHAPPSFEVVDVAGMTYKPACLKIRVGTTVTFAGNSSTHPLTAMIMRGTQPNPIKTPSPIPAPSFVFESEGAFGFYCKNHGKDAVGPTSGMSGAIYVVP